MAQREPEFELRLTDLGRAYLRMAPALVATWLVAGAPPGPGVREVFFTALLSVFVVAAVARSRGIGQGSSFRYGLQRAVSHSVNVLLLLLFLFLAAGLGGTLGGILADGVGLPQITGHAAGGFLGMLPILWWYWPVLVLACVTPEGAGERRAMTPWLWRGPGYTAARRLLRAFGSSRRTGLIIALAFLWVAVLAAVESYRGTSSLPALVEAASYGLFLPLLAWMATVEGHRLVASVPKADIPDAAPSPGTALLGLVVVLVAHGGGR